MQPKQPPADLKESLALVAERQLGDEVAMAIRSHRRDLGLSQRGYAERLGLTKSHVGRLESSPGELRLSVVLEALAQAGYDLALWDTAADEAEPSWPHADLVARDHAGRRLPAHLRASPTRGPPTWWWARHGHDLRRPIPRWTFERRASDPQRDPAA